MFLGRNSICELSYFECVVVCEAISAPASQGGEEVVGEEYRGCYERIALQKRRAWLTQEEGIADASLATAVAPWLTLKMSACLVGGCAGESTGACVVNSSEKFPTSNSLVM